jgi:hypothetical protein
MQEKLIYELPERINCTECRVVRFVFFHVKVYSLELASC